MENKKLIYVYTSTGQLVNNTPFIGFDSIRKQLFKQIKDESIAEDLIHDAELNCRLNGEMIFCYYFRPRPTTVFKTAQKFKTVKVY